MTRRSLSLPVVTTLCALLSGCHHSVTTVQRTAPTAPPLVGPVMVSVPPPTHHDQPEVVTSNVPAPKPVPETPRKVPRAQRRSSAASTQSAVVPATTAPGQAVAAPAPSIALGELSAGGEVSAGLKQQTSDLVKSQQQRIDAIGRADQVAHATEIAQAKTFLQHAITSWNAADYEGAHTLAVKAKVLLDDLQQ